MKEEKSKYKQDPRAMYIVSMTVFGTIGLFVSVLLLGERMTLLQVMGGCLVLGFTLWNEIGS